MKGKLRKFLNGLVSVLVVIALILGLGAYILPRQSFPQVTGQITIKGLDAAVDVWRDKTGIPHIYATTTHDLFFAQGYVHAQDRFWQMDFWRHVSSGRLSEMFGSKQLKTDTFLRTLGFMTIAEQEWQNLPDDQKAIFEAYTAGVNAYLAEHNGSAASLEYAIVSLLSPDYKIEPWQPQQSVAWPKVMALDLGGNKDFEIENAILLKTLSVEQLMEINPPYPADNPIIVPGFQPTAAGAENITAQALNYPDFQGLLEAADQNMQPAQALLGEFGPDIGSNDWVIGGALTASGMPILADDMHLGEQMPSIWYEAHLECVTLSAACPFNVTGYSFAGVPGIIVGHNNRIAWGFTNVGPDVQDLYIEKINPNDPNQYEYEGKWVDMEVRQETLKIAGGKTQELTVQITRHGPIISGAYGSLAEFNLKAGVELPAKLRHRPALERPRANKNNPGPAGTGSGPKLGGFPQRGQ